MARVARPRSADGAGGVVGLGAVAAVIPLWFLANYTVDTAIAPWVLPAFRRRPVAVAGGGVAAFLAIELMRMDDVAFIPQLNWILGWLLFQVAGFAWRDGLLPQGRRLAGVAAALWTAATMAVVVGPWPMAMVHHDGLTNSPTHPPSLSLMLFGAAYSATALVFAPWVSAALARSPRAWAGVVAANGVSLTVYLWHFTAFIAAAAIFHSVGRLPTADVATTAWWIQKVPIAALATVVLGVAIAAFSGVERRALMAPRRPWRGSDGSMVLTALAGSGALKLWVAGDAVAAVAGSSLVLVLWFALLRPEASEPIVGSDQRG